jgi:hypothetical protein
MSSRDDKISKDFTFIPIPEAVSSDSTTPWTLQLTKHYSSEHGTVLSSLTQSSSASLLSQLQASVTQRNQPELAASKLPIS